MDAAAYGTGEDDERVATGPRRSAGQDGRVRTGGLVTLPARMHDVQTSSRVGAPLTSARTRWMLGFQRRLVRRWEWLMLIPNDGFLPHTSQTAAILRRLPFVLLGERPKG